MFRALQMGVFWPRLLCVMASDSKFCNRNRKMIQNRLATGRERARVASEGINGWVSLVVRAARLRIHNLVVKSWYETT